jgi:single-stranded-DNA-specific exonuclease
VPAATLDDPRPLAEGRHVAFTVTAGGARSRGVRFGSGTRLPADPGEPVDAAVRLEANAFNGTIEPRLILRHARPVSDPHIEVVGEPATFAAGVLAEVARPLDPWPCAPIQPSGASTRAQRDMRGAGLAGTIADLVSTREPVLVVCAHVPQRAAALRGRTGGFALTSWAALADAPRLAERYVHVVALDPPAHPALLELLEHAPGSGWTHVCWGAAELDFAAAIHQWEYTLREPLAAVYRALRAAGGNSGEACEAVLRGEGTQPRTAALAGRLVRVLTELGLAVLDRAGLGLTIAETPARTALERSAAFQAYGTRLEDGRTYLTSSTAKAAA